MSDTESWGRSVKNTKWTDEEGFSLLELLAAMTLFSMIVVGFVFARNHAIAQAGEANDLRILRHLAGYQMGYLRLGYDHQRNEFEIGDDGGDFSHLGEKYESYLWTVNIEEMIVAGRAGDDDDGEYLFEDSEDVEEEVDAEEGDPVTVLRITLRVYHGDDYAEEGVEPGLQIVTFKPMPPEESETPAEGG